MHVLYLVPGYERIRLLDWIKSTAYKQERTPGALAQFNPGGGGEVGVGIGDNREGSAYQYI